MRDLGASWGELCVVGRDSQSVLEILFGDMDSTQNAGGFRCTFGKIPLFLPRTPLCSNAGFLLSCPSKDVAYVLDALVEARAVACDSEALEILRVEAGIPSHGRDVTGENLPQEIGRDDQAISFTKGCYFGQETVARIDAHGHVNRRLVGVKVDAERIPSPGEQLTSDGRPVGKITSAVWSPRFAAPLALALVRREHSQEGATLELNGYSAEVVVLTSS